MKIAALLPGKASDPGRMDADIERCVNRLKHFRRFATHCDRRTIHFKGLIHLAAIMLGYDECPLVLGRRGFRGCLRVLPEWVMRRRKAEKMDCDVLSRASSARTVARLMTICRDDLSKSQTVTVAAIEGGVLQLVEARDIIAAFQAMIRKKSLGDLEP